MELPAKCDTLSDMTCTMQVITNDWELKLDAIDQLRFTLEVFAHISAVGGPV